MAPNHFPKAKTLAMKISKIAMECMKANKLVVLLVSSYEGDGDDVDGAASDVTQRSEAGSASGAETTITLAAAVSALPSVAASLS